MLARCTGCHADEPSHPAFAAAPAGVVLESESDILANATRLHQQTVVLRAMPIGNLTGITEAERAVARAARRVAATTALVPMPAIDVAAVLFANVAMIRQVAEVYGGRAGALGSWRLTRAVLTHLVATGAVEIDGPDGEPMLSARKALQATELIFATYESSRSRQRVELDDGREAGLFLARGEVLRDGDLLGNADGVVVRVRAADEPVSEVRCDTPLLLARACYHLGNRHVALQIEPGRLRYRHDHVLDEMLRGLGLQPVCLAAPCPWPARRSRAWRTRAARVSGSSAPAMASRSANDMAVASSNTKLIQVSGRL